MAAVPMSHRPGVAGATVIASEINVEGIEATLMKARDLGVAVEMSEIDSADEKSATAWIDDAGAKHGGLDVIYNNAAHTHFAPFGTLSLHQWRETLRLELDIMFIPTKAAWPHLVRRGGGSIVNIASVWGMRATEDMGACAHAAGRAVSSASRAWYKRQSTILDDRAVLPGLLERNFGRIINMSSLP